MAFKFFENLCLGNHSFGEEVFLGSFYETPENPNGYRKQTKKYSKTCTRCKKVLIIIR